MGSSCSSELGCSRSSAVAPERRRAGGPSGGGGSSSRTEDDEDATTYSSSASRSRIRTARLAAEVAPFLPRRVISAFLSGRLHGNGFERTSGAAMPVPREMQGALLLVDVSGFTRLSESYAANGTGGCEDFSLLMSAFLARMCRIIQSHGGDIDCFAGDALLVVFSGVSSTGEDDQAAHAHPLASDVQAAVTCALDVSNQLNGYQPSAEHPALGIHAGLSCGTIYAVECGGRQVNRSEAFICGPALSELGVALDLSKVSELVVAPSAAGLIPNSTTAEPREAGCFCIALTAVGTLQDDTHRGDRGPGDKDGLLAEAMVERAMALSGEAAERDLREDPSEFTSFIHKLQTGSFFRSSGGSDRQRRQSLLDGSPDLCSGLEVLSAYVPKFVWQRCLDHAGFETIAENRRVAILFIVSGFQSSSWDQTAVLALQAGMGKVIDAVEGEFNGTTRQITMDEKGLAAIFVFGLPGFKHSNRPRQCVRAALLATELLAASGVPCSAGVDEGGCFCGLVGDPRQRCEYAVLGDTVNTAARIAWKAHKQGMSVCATERFKDALLLAESCSASSGMRVHMEPAGQVKLKGKEGETGIFRPSLEKASSFSYEAAPFLAGREADLETADEFLRARCCSSPDPECPLVLVVKGAAGMGKTGLLMNIGRRVMTQELRLDVRPRVIQISSHMSSIPFRICHSILEKLLLMDGEDNAPHLCCLEAPHIAEMAAARLPAILQPAAQDLRKLQHLQGQQRVASLYGIYRKVMEEALIKSPTVLTVDDADTIDQASLIVIASLRQTAEMPSRGPARGSARAAGKSAVILAGSQTLQVGEFSASGEGGSLGSMDGVVELHLGPLKESTVETLAGRLLQSDNGVTKDLLSVVMDHSRGVPLHIHHLCSWLNDQSMIDMLPSGVFSVRKAAKSITFSPPSLHNILASQLERLSPVLSQVVRCASVLGRVFKEEVLDEMMDGTIGQGELPGLLAQLSEYEMVHAEERGSGTWQFAHPVYMEAAYSTILQKHRRSLHRKVQELLAEDLHLDGGSSLAVQADHNADVQEQLAYHWRCILGKVEKWKAAAAERDISPRDLRSGSSAYRWLGKHYVDNGLVREASVNLEVLLGWCRAALSFESSEPWLTAATELASWCVELYYDLQRHDPTHDVLSAEQLEKFRAAVTEVSQQGAKAAQELATPVSGAGLRRSSDRRGGHKLAVIAANAKVATVVAEFVPKHRIRKETVSKLRCDWYVAENRPEPKALYGAFAVLLSWPYCQFRDCRDVAEEMYDILEPLGKPSILSVSPVATFTSCLLGLWMGGSLCGHLDEPGMSERVEAESLQLELFQRLLLCTIQLGLEGAMEPPCSPRMRTLLDTLAACQATVGGRAARQAIKSHKKLFQDHFSPLLAAAEHEELLLCHVQHPGGNAPAAAAADNCPAPPPGTSTAQVQRTWEALIVAACNAAKTGPVFFSCMMVARHVVHHGCRVIFPELPQSDTPSSHGGCRMVSPLGVQHLRSVAELLSDMMAHWEKKHSHVDLGQHLLPGCMLYCKAMLSWFQWRLHLAGELGYGSITDPRMGVSGVHGWPRGQAVPPGLQSISRALLLAQAMSMGDETREELLPGCLPATTCLARLLLGHGFPGSSPEMPSKLDNNVQQRRGFTAEQVVFVPEEPLVRGSHMDVMIPVLPVRPRSEQALCLAKAHLAQVLSLVKVAGRSVSGTLTSLTFAQVGSSVPIWEAVCLHNQIVRELPTPPPPPQLPGGDGRCIFDPVHAWP